MKFVLFFIALLSSAPLIADSDILAIPEHPNWKEECGICHIAYPPQLLTASAWQRLMSELARHFGVNAELDANTNTDILAFLRQHAGSAWDGMSSESGLRVTDTPWFDRKHRKVPNKLWFDATVKSPANCTACHVSAERGDWSISSIKIPMPNSPP